MDTLNGFAPEKLMEAKRSYGSSAKLWKAKGSNRKVDWIGLDQQSIKIHDKDEFGRNSSQKSNFRFLFLPKLAQY